MYPFRRVSCLVFFFLLTLQSVAVVRCSFGFTSHLGGIIARGRKTPPPPISPSIELKKGAFYSGK